MPPAPPDKTGWPWTIGSSPLFRARHDGSPWPRISIVTPSYNQSQFIEETIRSILLQSYPNLEYIIIDGGSTDKSVEIIKKYEPWLSYWISEKDRGQAHAINKGLLLSSGEVFQWINSDDVLLPNALTNIGAAFYDRPIAAPILTGKTLSNSQERPNRYLTAACLLSGRAVFSQPGLWLVRQNVVSIGIDEREHYAFDWDMTIRYLETFPGVTEIWPAVVFFREHAGSKTIEHADMFGKEGLAILARLSHSLAKPSHRTICRETCRRLNWQRHLTKWREEAHEQGARIAIRMFLLGIRNPRLRVSRFWMGALRRAIFPQIIFRAVSERRLSIQDDVSSKPLASSNPTRARRGS